MLGYLAGSISGSFQGWTRSMVSNRPQGTYGGASQTRPLPTSDEAVESHDELAASATDPVPPQRELSSLQSQHNHTSSSNHRPIPQSRRPEHQEVRLTDGVDSTAKQAAKQATSGSSQSPDHYISPATWQYINRQNTQLRDQNAKLVQDKSHFQRLYSNAHVELTAVNDRERNHQNTEARLKEGLAEYETTIQETNALLEKEKNKRVREKMEFDSRLVNAKAEARLWQKSLEECRGRIFRMQPLEHTTDAKLAGQYQSLCDAIGDWADSHFGEFENLLAGTTKIKWPEDSPKLIRDFLLADGEIGMVLDYPHTGSSC